MTRDGSSGNVRSMDSQVPRRQFLKTIGLGGPAIAFTAGTETARAAEPAAAEPAAAEPVIREPALATAAGPNPPYPTLQRPFAMPGVKDQDWTGALFAGDGEFRFALRVGLVTAQGKLLREKMTKNLWRIGPMTPDGAYKEVSVSTDDRTIMSAIGFCLIDQLAEPYRFKYLFLRFQSQLACEVNCDEN